MEDYLTRKPYLDLLKSIIEKQKDSPTGYSFAIDGEWGSGKTWILQELEKQLLKEKDNKYLIFHYNAWENDFYDEPLVAILSVMIDSLDNYSRAEETANKINAKLAQTAIKIFKNLAISIANYKLKDKTGLEFRDVINDIKEVSNAKSKHAKMKKEIDNYSSLKDLLTEIHNQIKSLSEEVNILLIVDELDRCLPEYAIKVLERLHHVCNDKPVIQLLAINKKTLTDSIVKVFGKDIFKIEDPKNLTTALKWNEHFADSYLQKFVNVLIPLPNGKLDSRLEILNGLDKSFVPFTRTDFGGEGINVNEEYLSKFIAHLFSGTERRQQEKIISLTSLCHELTLASGAQLELNSYAILIYEIISCICRYVFHLEKTCTLTEGSEEYYLCFFNGIGTIRNPDKKESNNLNSKLHDLLSCHAYYNEAFRPRELFPLEIKNTTTFMMAFFYDSNIRDVNPVIDGLWSGIRQDKIFLSKFDEIMNILVIKDTNTKSEQPAIY